jgi:hypothetical protein
MKRKKVLGTVVVEHFHSSSLPHHEHAEAISTT